MKQSAASHADEEGEEEEEEEEEDDGELGFINNHDLIGVKGIITAQKNEIEKKKVSQLIFIISVIRNIRKYNYKCLIFPP